MRIRAAAIRVGDRVRRPGASGTAYAEVLRVYPVTTDRRGNRLARVSFGGGTGAQWSASEYVTVLRESSRRPRRNTLRFVPVAEKHAAGVPASGSLTSTFITALAYNSSTEELRVYINGRGYAYAGVSRHVFYRMRKARSVGGYYTRNIRGRYDRAVSGAA